MNDFDAVTGECIVSHCWPATFVVLDKVVPIQSSVKTTDLIIVIIKQ